LLVKLQLEHDFTITKHSLAIIVKILSKKEEIKKKLWFGPIIGSIIAKN